MQLSSKNVADCRSFPEYVMQCLGADYVDTTEGIAAGGG